MNRVFRPTEEALLFRLSNAAERYRTTSGSFKVICQNNRQKSFETLVDAFLFYISVDEAADLFDASNGDVLIERKVRFCLN